MLLNPYQGAIGEWVRGSFHGHCTENSGCSTVPLAEGVRLYHEVGAGFIALTDHDTVTDLRDVEARYPDIVFLRGFEYSRAENLLFVGTSVPPLYLLSLAEAMAQARGLLTIVCHPQPGRQPDYWTEKKVLALGRMPDGIEVYNGHYGIDRMVAAGCRPQYTEFWDGLLTAGHRVWGFANDDFHEPADFDNAFNMVLVQELTAEEILRSAKAGRCYASTGLLLDRFEEDEGTLRVSVRAHAVGRFVGPKGTILAEGEGAEFEYTANGERYVRFEAEGETGKLFLQPLFRE